MRKTYEEGHVTGASRAKNNATKQIRKRLKLKNSKIAGTSPNERFESVLELASKKFKKLKRSAKSAIEAPE